MTPVPNRQRTPRRPGEAAGGAPWRRVRALVFVLLASLLAFAVGQDCALEQEPNDTPAEANALVDFGCLVGELPGNDQDAWVWEVSEAQAGVPWAVEIEGIPGELTKLDLIRVTFADNGVDVTSADTLWTFGTRDGRLNASEPFLIGPGRYILGISKSGGSGRYVAHFRPQRALDRDYRPFGRLGEAEGELYGFGPVEESAEIVWQVREEDAEFLWNLELRASLGAAPALTLEGPEGEIVSGRAGDGIVRFDGLGLEPGRHTLRLSGGAGMAALSARRAGRITEGHEVEPNDGWGSANVLPMDRALRGSGGNEDRFLFEVDEEAAAGAWNLIVDADAEVGVALFDEQRELLQQRRGHGGSLRDLGFAAGRYGFMIHAPDGSDYELRFQPTDPPAPGFEREPNDRVAGAHDLAGDPQVRGELAGGDVDVFRFEASGPAQLWRVQAVGEGVREVEVLDGNGSRVQGTRGERRLRLDNLRILPGVNYLRVSGDGGQYALRAIPLGPAPEPEEAGADDAPLESAPSKDAVEADAADDRDPERDEAPDADEDEEREARVEAEEIANEPLPPPPPGRMELEPNDDRSRSELLRAGEVRVGTHHAGRRDEVDVYRFYLPHDQYVRIEAVPPEGGAIRFDTTGAPRAGPIREGGPSVLETWLHAGDHFVETWATDVADGYYQLRLSVQDALAVPVDAEPNDDFDRAVPLPASLSWDGVVGNQSDADHYRLPVFERDATFTAAVSGDVRHQFWADGDGFRHQAEEGVLRAEVPAGAQVVWRIRGSDTYRVEASFDHDPPPGSLRPDPRAGEAALTFEGDRRHVSAYWHEGQTVRTSVRVENRAAERRTFTLEARAGNAAVDARLGEPEVQLAPGQSVDVPVTVRIPPDVRDDQALSVTVAARSETSVDTGTLELVARCDAPPVDPAPAWRVPDPMLGGLNAALGGFGARVANEEDADYLARLFDGRTAPSTGVHRQDGFGVVVELAGDEPVQLTGTLLHPQTNGSTTRQLRAFRIETSLDGERFETVLEDELETARIEQAFPFDEPVRARYARLTFLGNHERRRSSYLGEWKLVASPAWAPEPINLADPARGGYVVWSDPLLSSPGRLLSPDASDARRLDLRDAREQIWVLGFHHDRAARIERLEWVESPDAPEAARFPEVLVEASLTGGAGPWRELGTWRLERSDGVATLVFEEPVWARNLRFTAEKIDGERYAWPPGVLRVLEAPAGGDFRSALGEWGHYRREAAYEWSTSEQAPVRRLEDDAHDDRGSALSLSSHDRIAGSVLVAEDEDWYRLTVAEDENRLEIHLRGDPSIGYEYELVDEAGEPVFFEIHEQGHDLTLRAYPGPGDYFLRLWEPKRSVVFSWDTSGSVSPYQTTTYSALASFATDVDPAREFVQLLAFDDPLPIWLLPYWSSDPERVQTALNGFDRDAGSSNAEHALLVATKALASRDGTRAILFMTDAESPGYDLTADLWRALSEVRPRVFSFEISTAGSDYSQDLMQSWASVNEGFYDYTRNVADFGAGFARASCHLRRPKRYELEVRTEAVEPPGPGTVSVRRAEGADLPALEVIFDASGSMGAPLPSGRPRIEVAKEVLAALVTDILPEGTPFAFRAFGHIAPQSCETRLDVPLTPLDPDVARAAFDAIEPKLLSQTPIADSLREVARDLSGTEASKTVVLITDGEESCGGDPEAALAELRDAGVEVQLSIVSLGLDEAEARERFAALAELGGGTYVDADDRESLQASVEEALHPPFEVLDTDGAVAARGRVGGPGVEVPMGVYTVRVPGSPPQVFRGVRVEGDGSVAVTVGTQR